MEVIVTNDLALAIGDRSAQLLPGEAFRLAECLIRRATVRMVEEEVTLASPACAKEDEGAGNAGR
jgi:hypothetical protein